MFPNESEYGNHAEDKSPICPCLADRAVEICVFFRFVFGGDIHCEQRNGGHILSSNLVVLVSVASVQLARVSLI